MTEGFNYHAQVQVRFNETDQQGHVNFGHYLFYFDFALTAYLAAIGYPYHRMATDGVDMLYVGSRANYRAPAYFDEVLNVHARIGRIGNSSVRFDFQVVADGDGRAIADGDITVVMVDRETRKKIPVPTVLRDAVARADGGGPASTARNAAGDGRPSEPDTQSDPSAGTG